MSENTFTIKHDGDTWRILGTGLMRDGKIYSHLASTTKGVQQKSGWNPMQICDWVDADLVLSCLAQREKAMRTALEEAIEYLEPRVEGGKVGVNLLPRLKAVIANVEGGESPTNNDGWISVLDRLPEKEGLYAVYLARTEYGGINKDGSVGKVEYDWWRSHHWEPESAWGYWELGEEDWQWSTTKNPDRIGTIITHWQPAPQPPVNAPKAPLTDAERDKIISALDAARNRGEK